MTYGGARKIGAPDPSPSGGLTFAMLASPPSSRLIKRGGLGYASTGVGFAVEFDISQDSWDPSINHVGINTNGSVTSRAFADPPFPMGNGEPTHVWIDFNGVSLLVFISQENNTKPDEPLVTQDIDLCSVLRRMPMTSSSQRFYAGFTTQSDKTLTNQIVTDWCLTIGECLCT